MGFQTISKWHETLKTFKNGRIEGKWWKFLQHGFCEILITLFSKNCILRGIIGQILVTFWIFMEKIFLKSETWAFNNVTLLSSCQNTI